MKIKYMKHFRDKAENCAVHISSTCLRRRQFISLGETSSKPQALGFRAGTNTDAGGLQRDVLHTVALAVSI